MATDMRRRGQAMVETALGMFALALVLSALFGFAAYITESLDMRRSLRAKAGRCAMASSGGPDALVTAGGSRRVRIDSLAARYSFGREEVSARESVSMPPMGGEL